MSSGKHSWQFYRVGGLDQVTFGSGEDIANLEQLDRKLWVALACPVKGLEFDERTLALIDSDNDGRIRVAEVLEAVAFLKARLRSLDPLLAGSDALSLDAIDATRPEGAAALASARRILLNLGKDGATSISFADVTDPARIGARFNGDGVITPETADDEATAAVIRDILATHGALLDRAGHPGIDKPRAEAFFTDVHALHAWAARAEAQGGPCPFGKDTPAIHAAVKAVRVKVEDYFARCRLAAYDARALAAVNRAETEYLALAAADLTIGSHEIASFPIARIEANRPLPLSGTINPAWEAALARFAAEAVAPVFGKREALDEKQWRELTAGLAPYESWLAARPVTKVEALGAERLRALADPAVAARVLDLIARDAALATEASGIDAVEKLVRLNRDFVRLLNNFVTFADFYGRKRLATFQAGRLYVDSRECHLCIRVEDAGKHAALAGLSRCYLAYCDVARRGGSEKMQVLAIVTQGDSDHLMAGRNGLFIDRAGRDWDATVTRIVDAPISIRQAFFSPYKKFVRMIEEQVAKRAAAAGAASEQQLSQGAEQLAHVDKAAAAPPPKAEPPKKLDLGTIALIGTAISGVAAMAGLVLEKFFGLGVYMPLGILAIVLLFSGPSMLIAMLKLRQRSLAPILDASGWAINGRVKITLPFGAALTSIAHLPIDARLTLQDPYAEKKSPWPKLLLAAVLVVMAAWALFRSGLLARLGLGG
jgi:hypothetical protein